MAICVMMVSPLRSLIRSAIVYVYIFISKEHCVNIKSHKLALSGVAQWIECQPENQRVSGSVPNEGTCLGFEPGAQEETPKKQPHADVSLPVFLLLFPSLK